MRGSPAEMLCEFYVSYIQLYSSSSSIQYRVKGDMNVTGPEFPLDVRIVTVDYYLSKPVIGLDLFKSPVLQRISQCIENEGVEVQREVDSLLDDVICDEERIKVPVIRVFGRTCFPSGQSVCLHVHNIYPYFYIRLASKLTDPFEIALFELQTMITLEKALRDCFRDNNEDGETNSEMANHDSSKLDKSREGNHSKKFIHNVEYCERIMFYGYHDRQTPFARIEVYDPGMVSRIVNIVHKRNSLVDKSLAPIYFRPLQAFESHIPFILQFFTDYDLHGMDFLRSNVHSFRRPLPISTDCKHLGNFICKDNVPRIFLGSLRMRRETWCEIEADILKSSILATQNEEDAGNDFQVHSLRHIWKEERHRRKSAGLDSQTFLTPELQRESDVNYHLASTMIDLSALYKDQLKELVAINSAMEISSQSPSTSQMSQSSKLDSQDQFAIAILGQSFDTNSFGKKDSNLFEDSEEEQTVLDDLENIRTTQLEFENALSPAKCQDDIDNDNDQIHELSNNQKTKKAKILEQQIHKRIWTPNSSPPSLQDIEDLHVNAAGKNSSVQKSIRIDSAGRQVGVEPIQNKKSIKPDSPKHDESGSFLPVNEGLEKSNFSQHTKTSQEQFLEQNLTFLKAVSIEILCDTRGTLLPNPSFDSVRCVSMVFWRDSQRNGIYRQLMIILISDVDADLNSYIRLTESVEVLMTRSEIELFDVVCKFIISEDPDVLLGFEIVKSSIGYLVDRYKKICGDDECDFVDRLSRIRKQKFDKSNSISSNDDSNKEKVWEKMNSSSLNIIGRIVLDLWRIFRSEIKLGIYTFQNCMAKILGRRVPYFSPCYLSRKACSTNPNDRRMVYSFLATMSKGNIEMFIALNLFQRSSEMARLFGIQFFEVFSRGSQFRVESMLIRLVKSKGFIAVSPTKDQVFHQDAIECIPLVLEPESKVYYDPVVVLDFQSLYPSMVIAYNMCYSTCLGKVYYKDMVNKKFGAYNLDIRPGMLAGIENDCWISPNGVVFVKPSVRTGILPVMLKEILDTRVMIKTTMKEIRKAKNFSGWEEVCRILDSRQFGLKMIANVTYGYTSAGFSGRMPCADIADAIVQTGRCTLEKAISLVEENKNWKARVVYGDTDSLMVLLEGRSREDAFVIGKEIAGKVAELNPYPVKLKLEKVFQPCVFVSKKRYVGYAWESSDQISPVFDDKGIETVRRDGCPLLTRIMQKSLRLLFENARDDFELRRYLSNQITRILTDEISLDEFIFCKEVKLGSYRATFATGTLPPSAIVSHKLMQNDPRAEPLYGERIPYIVVYGEPGSRLVDLVVSLREYIENNSLRINSMYYIKKQLLPALNRILALKKIDIFLWFAEIPRPSTLSYNLRSDLMADKSKFRRKQLTLDHFYNSKRCPICGEFNGASLQVISDHWEYCKPCKLDSQDSAVQVISRAKEIEKTYFNSLQSCGSCTGNFSFIAGCQSLECPIYFLRFKSGEQLRNFWRQDFHFRS